MRPLSTAPEEDLTVILRRALFAWLIADGDMHLKNLALLKIAAPGADSFESVRMAPLYDAVTTRVFPRLEHDRMALKLDGKDDRLRRADFLRLAATAGIPARAANAAIDELIERFATGLDQIIVPDVPNLEAEMTAKAEQMLELCATACDACEKMCDMHDDAHCKRCAQMCRECAADCRKAAQNL